MDLLTAVARINESIGVEAQETPDLPTPIDNARALQQLQAMVGGMAR